MPKKIILMGYTINELDPEVQKCVINRYSEINTDYDWYDSCYEEFHKILTEYGLECKWFAWDLYRSEFDFRELRIVNQTLLLSKLQVSNYLIPLELKLGNGNYFIEMSATDCYVLVDITDDYALTSPDVNDEELQEVEDCIQEKFSVLIRDLEKRFLQSLKDTYEDITSEESIVDTLDINGYLFTKEGKTI